MYFVHVRIYHCTISFRENCRLDINATVDFSISHYFILRDRSVFVLLSIGVITIMKAGDEDIIRRTVNVMLHFFSSNIVFSRNYCA